MSQLRTQHTVLLLLLFVSSAVFVSSADVFTGDFSVTHTNLQNSGGSFTSTAYLFTSSNYAQTTPGSPVAFPGAPASITVSFRLSSYPSDKAAFLYWTASGNAGNQQYYVLYIHSDGTFTNKLQAPSNGAISMVNTRSAFSVPLNADVTIIIQYEATSMTLLTSLGNSVTYTYSPAETVPAATIGGGNIFIGDTDASGMAGSISELTFASGLDTFADGNGDPQFTGFHGQSYQVHGYPDAWFNIIASPEINVNAKFAYIEAGTCDYNNTACWTHPGTYMSSFGITIPDQSGDNNSSIRVSLTAGPHAIGLLDARVNGRVLSVGNRMTTSTVSIHRAAHDRVSIKAGAFIMHVTNSDMFFNMQLQLQHSIIAAGEEHVHIVTVTDVVTTHKRKHSHDIHPVIAKTYPNIPIHGLVGQTWRNVVWPAGLMYEGSVDDYVCSAQFEHDSVYNSYVQHMQQL